MSRPAAAAFLTLGLVVNVESVFSLIPLFLNLDSSLFAGFKKYLSFVVLFCRQTIFLC